MSESFEPARAQGGENLVVHAHALPKDRRNGRLGHVVGRGTEATGGDDSTGAFERVTHGRLDAVGVVAAGGSPYDAYAECRQLAPEMRGVGIDGESEQQLVADGDDFQFHV